MAPWRLRNATMAVAGPGLTAGSSHTPATCPSGAPVRTAGVAGIAGRAHAWGRMIVTAPPEGIDQTPGGFSSGRFFWPQYSVAPLSPFKSVVHFLVRTRKPNQKKAPVSRFLLRVDGVAGARGNSPASRRAQTVRALIPVHPVNARRGTKGNQKTINSKSAFMPSLRVLPEDDCFVRAISLVSRPLIPN